MDMVNVIDKIESLVATSTSVPVTQRKLVDASKVMELVDKLRLSVPQDVKSAQEVISRKDSIQQQAQAEARHIRNAAEEEYSARLEQSEILKTARHRADQLIADADDKAKRILNQVQVEAKTRRADADTYALQAMRTLEKQLTALLSTVRKGLDVLAVKEY
jgi:cell division septum initiation protein DivIVA